jgi:hypothetical protein
MTPYLPSAAMPPLAWVEPHRPLLQQPEPGQRLFKIIKVQYLIDMLQRKYLHFRRVDTYTDDSSDSEQLPLDRKVSESVGFEKDPTYTLAKYYDTARARTYACCFSLEHSAYLWKNYAPERDGVCLAFDFDKLRERLNDTVRATVERDGLLMHGDIPLKQIFSINYGIVDYVDRQAHAVHPVRMANPIQFTYLKEKGRYASEKELRIALSALGIGQFILLNGAAIEFPPTLQMHFDFPEAFSSGAITEILCPPDFVDAAHLDSLVSAVEQLGAEARMAVAR